jgi:signal transduction histidine kinase
VVHQHTARWRPAFARTRRELEVVADKNVLVRASRGTVGQVLDVLLDNALRHGRGAVRVEVSAGHRQASLTVTDSGPGIPDELQDRIFERGDSRGGGTGIGLHLARALAQSDNGSLRVVNDETTRFELRLPRVAL